MKVGRFRLHRLWAVAAVVVVVSLLAGGALVGCGTVDDAGDAGVANDSALQDGAIDDVTADVADGQGDMEAPVDTAGEDVAGVADTAAAADVAPRVDAGVPADAGDPTQDAGPTCPGGLTCDCKDSLGCDSGACIDGKCVDPCALTAGQKPVDEICDGKDNNCDGKTDEQDCGDGNPCTGDYCDPAAKACKNTPVSDDTACSDGDMCTNGDMCKSGKCAPGVAAICNDGNPCTDDSCKQDKGCIHAQSTKPCDDGNACSKGDVCAGGQCAPGQALKCDDGDGCTDDACNPASGCTQTVNSAACDDGDACTAKDMCAGGKCTSGSQLACDDGNVCTKDACDKAKGCTQTPVSAACNDGNKCTEKDMCKAGKCAAGPTLKCDDGNGCTDDSCDPAGGCKQVANSAACDDGDACTAKDGCKASKCAPGSKLTCDDGNVCTKDSCNKASGCVHTKLSSACDDGSKCTTKDTCVGGKCVGTKQSCDDGNVCTKDSCDSAAGCKHAPATGPCPDADPCTSGAACKAGKCAAGSSKSCDDGQACTADKCDPKTGCVHTPTKGSCEDGNVCLTSDCATGKCAPKKGPWRIDTWVGWHTDHRDGPRKQAKFHYLNGVAVDAKGQVWLGDRDNHMVRRIDNKGMVWTAGGNGRPGFQDGPAANARFHTPGGLVADAQGRVLVADYNNRRVRRIELNGMVTTLAGSGPRGYKDGPGKTAKFMGPYDVAIGPKGTIFVADQNRVRRIDSKGVVSTHSASKDISDLRGIDVDSKGDVWVVLTLGLRVYKITPDGTAHWVSGFGFGKNDGIGHTKGKTARYYYATGIMVDKKDQVWIVDANNHRLRLMTDTKAGKVITVGGTTRGHLDGPLKSAKFDYPHAMALDPKSGAMYVVERTADRVRRILNGQVSTWAGQPHINHKDGKGKAARIGFPRANALDAKGNVYVADMFQHTIRKIDKDGNMTTLAGKAGVKGSVVGKGSAARFNNPYGVGVDGKGIIYASERHGAKIRKITPDGTATILAGGGSGFADGKGAAAKFKLPRGIAVAANGVVFVADTNNSRIRKVMPDGTVTTLAGGQNGYLDGQGTKAKFNSPYDLALGPKGNLWIADTGPRAIRRVTPGGAVTTLAGGVYGFADGIGKKAQFLGPLGIAVAKNGTLYVSDTSTIRKVTAAGVVTTILGTLQAFTIDGPAPIARLRQPTGLTIRPDGALIVSDSYSRSIRIVQRAPTWPLDCDDGDACTTEACSPKSGCSHKELPSGEGSCYSGPKGTLGVGVCVAGSRSCGKGASCDGQVVPAKAEICGNGLDDDCDGHADTGCLVLTSISCKHRYTCGLTPAGAPVCWGFASSEPPTLPKGPFKQLATGRDHACAVTSGGKVTCWGSNGGGQLKVSAGSYNQVAAGRSHSCGVRKDGTLACWGSDKFKQSTPPSGKFKRVYAGWDGSCGLRTDDSLVCWGAKFYSGAKPPAGKYVSASLHEHHGCAIRTDGGVRCWGYANAVLGTPKTGTFKAVGPGEEHTCGVTSAGKLSCWGKLNNNIKAVFEPPKGTYKAVAAGWRHSCALRTDGRVRCWGVKETWGAMQPPGGLKPM